MWGLSGGGILSGGGGGWWEKRLVRRERVRIQRDRMVA